MDNILHLTSTHSRSTRIRYGFAALAGLSLLRVAYLKVSEISAQKEIDFRKKQLAKDVYVLEGDELVNPPWNKNNIKDWLYRRVQVSGRPLFYRTCHVPNFDNALDGYEQVVPLVTKETKTKQEGIMLSRGFVPAKLKDFNSRVRIQDVTKQTFTGFVSTLSELSGRWLLQGNTTTHGKIGFTHADLKDFAEASQFQNKKQMELAIIQEIDSSGPIDQRTPRRRAFDLEYAVQYPYKKTYAGALQLAKMPWHYRSEANLWLGISVLSLIKFFI